MDDLRLDHPGEFLIQPAVEESQLAVIQSHQMQEGGVQIADVMAVGRKERLRVEGIGVKPQRRERRRDFALDSQRSSRLCGLLPGGTLSPMHFKTGSHASTPWIISGSITPVSF